MAVAQRIEAMSNPHMGKKLKTCAYCRVSSNSADQLNSYATQVRHYTKAIQARADWEFVDIFADATDIIGLKQNPTKRASL